MKFLAFIYIYIIACFAAYNLSAQTQDSVFYVTPEEEALMIDKETTSLFKFNPLVISDESFSSLNSFTFAFEQKLGNKFSITPSVEFNLTSSLDDLTYINFGLEGRYYIDNQKINNLSGKFISMKYENAIFPNNNFNMFIDGLYSFEIGYGIQNRFLNYGYLERKISLTYNEYKFDDTVMFPQGFGPKFKSIVLSSQYNVGFGLGKKYDIDEMLKCPIMRCQKDRLFGLKYNFRRTWNIGYRYVTDNEDFNAFFVNLSPNIAYEHKINKSSFTLNHDLDMNLSFSTNRSNNVDSGFGLSDILVSYSPGLRFYLLQKSKILSGDSGNNLSGLYGFVQPKFTLAEDYRIEFNPTNVDLEEFNTVFIFGQVGIGYQKEILQNLYFDIDMGVSKKFNRPDSNRFENLSFIGNIRVGFILDSQGWKSMEKQLSLF